MALLSPEVRKSPAKLDKLLADDFFEFTQSGASYTKQDVMKVLPTRAEEKFVVRDYIEKQLSSDVVLVRYIVDREILESGEKRCTLCSSIWQNKNNAWQMIFFQGTPAQSS